MGDRRELLRRLCTALEHPGVNGVLATPEVVDDLLLLGALEEKVVIGSMNRGGLQKASFELDDRFTAYRAQTIAAMGFEGGKTPAPRRPQRSGDRADPRERRRRGERARRRRVDGDDRTLHVPPRRRAGAQRADRTGHGHGDLDRRRAGGQLGAHVAEGPHRGGDGARRRRHDAALRGARRGGLRGSDAAYAAWARRSPCRTSTGSSSGARCCFRPTMTWPARFMRRSSSARRRAAPSTRGSCRLAGGLAILSRRDDSSSQATGQARRFAHAGGAARERADLHELLPRRTRRSRRASCCARRSRGPAPTSSPGRSCKGSVREHRRRRARLPPRRPRRRRARRCSSSTAARVPAPFQRRARADRHRRGAGRRRFVAQPGSMITKCPSKYSAAPSGSSA